MKVSEETSTSSSAWTPASSRAMCRAAVPLTVATAYFVPARSATIFLEPVDVAADGRDPVRIEAFLDVLPLVPADLGHDQGNEIRAARGARSQFFCWVQLRYLPSPKSTMILLRTRCATSSMPCATVRVILKPSWLSDAGERHTVVPRIFRLMHELDDGIGRIGSNHVDELLLLEVLIGRAHVEYGCRRLSRAGELRTSCMARAASRTCM